MSGQEDTMRPVSLTPSWIIRTLSVYELTSHRGSNVAQGETSCRRCRQVNIECIIAKSRRGGARTRDSRSATNAMRGDVLTPSPSRPENFAGNSVIEEPGPEPFDTGNHESWSSPRDQGEPSASRNWQRDWPDPAIGPPSAPSRPSREPDSIENHINNTDLLNPSDAMDLLAEVADRNTEVLTYGSNFTNPNVSHQGRAVSTAASTVYPVIQDGFLTRADVSHLLSL